MLIKTFQLETRCISQGNFAPQLGSPKYQPMPWDCHQNLAGYQPQKHQVSRRNEGLGSISQNQINNGVGVVGERPVSSAQLR